MNDQEREVIADIFRRLEQVANETRDPEAERFIAERMRQQPYAAYAMAQTIFIQEQALTNLQEEIEQLRAQIEEARRQPQASGGILSSLFGGSPRHPEPEPFRRDAEENARRSPWGAPSVPQRRSGHANEPQEQGATGPWGGGMAQSRGGGFLQGALSTAAGVAGGMMVANALTSAFGGKHGADPAAAGDKTALADTGAADGATDNASITDSLYENPDTEQHASFDDFEGDGGDEGDWA